MTRWLSILSLLVRSRLSSSACSQDETPGIGHDAEQRLFELFESRVFTAADGKQLPYRLMKPEAFDPDKEYPLVLYLHGRGGCGSDNRLNVTDTGIPAVFASEEKRRQYPAIVLVPQCPAGQAWARTGRRNWGKPVQPLVFGMLDSVLSQLKVDRQRIYVTGLSLGGMGTFGMVAARPDLFAAAVAVCGGWDPAQAAEMTAVPFWIFHGRLDPLVPVKYSRKMVDALKQAGGDVTYTEYPDVKHPSWTRAYATEQMWQWMFAKRRTTDYSPSTE